MITHTALPSAPARRARKAELTSRPDESAGAEPQGPGLPGRKAVTALLERRFPGVFAPLGELHAERSESRWEAAPGAYLARIAASVRLWRERSRTRQALSRLSDVQLRDFGMSRSQIFQEMNKPFWKA